jgi:hypothetical protein
MYGYKFISLVILFFVASTVYSYDFYVSPKGSDLNSGTKTEPLYSLQKACEEAQKLIQKKGYPEEGINILIAGGNYTINKTLTFHRCLRGKDSKPIIFKAYDEKAIFEGGSNINLSSAKAVDDPSILSLLNENARGEVYSVEIKNPEIKSLLEKGSIGLSFNGKMMTLAKYPNIGFGHIDKIIDKGAVYAKNRTKGEPPDYNMQSPVGGIFTVLNKNISAWESEFQRIQKAEVIGYLSNDWYKENHRVASIHNGQIQLLDYSRYGLGVKKEIPRRFIIENLLCELDSPGEFYFDQDSNNLFFWPFDRLNKDSNLTIGSGPAFADLREASNIKFENITIEGVSKGAAVFNIKDCNNIEIAGCIIKNCSIPAVVVEGGSKCGIRSCDIYDVPQHLILNGGDTKTLTPSGHYAINNQFTQVQATGYYGKIEIKGVGQIFQHNLVHNFIGQIMTVSGNDHLFEYNEFFNVGIEEGDGGCIYSGAEMWSWGNVYRHNFLHHLMCLPQAHPRGGIYPDDRDQGDTIVENIFYKAAHRAICINGGAGFKVNRNIFLNGNIGIFNTEALAEETYEMQAKYDKGELLRGDKADYIWRTEQVVGKEGWNRKPWITKYPDFAKIMNQGKMRFWPIDCDFSDNCFAGNFQDIQYRTGYGKADMKEISEVPFIRAANNRQISMDVFTNSGKMNFTYKNKDIASKWPDIQFDKIGLYKDKFRVNPPDKNKYRNAISKRFASCKSFDPDAVYNPTTINDLIYFNTGKILVEQHED